MPNRILRDGILTSVRVNSLSTGGELFFRRLMSCADDFGRFTAHLTLLRSQLYPLKIDVVKESDVAKWLNECKEVKLLDVYVVNEADYLEITGFNQRTRAMKSKFPTRSCASMCNTDDGQVTAEGGQARSSAHGDGDGDGDVYGDGKPKSKARKAKKKEIPFPDDFSPSDTHTKIAKERGLDLTKALDFYRNWVSDKDIRQVGWNGTVTNALNGWLGEKFTSNTGVAGGQGLNRWE